jgi:hypothetical protein
VGELKQKRTNMQNLKRERVGETVRGKEKRKIEKERQSKIERER